MNLRSLLVAIPALAGCATIPPDQAALAECVARGGHLVAFTQASAVCARPATDAGKSCTDSKQCQGLCLPPAGTTASSTSGRSGKDAEVVGTCAAVRLDFKLPNCQDVVRLGRVVSAPCYD